METQVFKVPESFKKDFKYTFCPGCDHGVAIRLVGECLDELGIRDNAIIAASIGCSVTIYDFLNIDALESPHGRAMAEATGIKRARPDKFVFTYQGDGDFASIGLAEGIHAALRGEKLSAICINTTPATTIPNICLFFITNPLFCISSGHSKSAPLLLLERSD